MATTNESHDPFIVRQLRYHFALICHEDMYSYLQIKKMRNTTPLRSLPSSRHHLHILIPLLPETVETHGGLNRYVESSPLLKSPCRVIHSVVCLTTGPYPLPKWVFHRVRSSASSFNFQHPLISLRSSKSCILILPRLPVTSVLPSIFPSITCLRRQFVRKI